MSNDRRSVSIRPKSGVADVAACHVSPLITFFFFFSLRQPIFFFFFFFSEIGIVGLAFRVTILFPLLFFSSLSPSLSRRKIFVAGSPSPPPSRLSLSHSNERSPATHPGRKERYLVSCSPVTQGVLFSGDPNGNTCFSVWVFDLDQNMI
jgi:hypothetical protein